MFITESQAMTFTSGTKLGPYEILSAIGTGGQGEVYKARDERLSRTIAIKVLSSHRETPDLLIWWTTNRT